MSDASAAVYVVDDHVSVRESVQGLIRSANFRAETFASARELLDRCRDEIPGCLVLDVNLPGLSGLDVQQELASAEVHVPVIFITGHGDVPTSVRAMKSGALEFLTKPLDCDALLAAIRQGIARSPKGASARRKALRTLAEPMVGDSPAFKAAIDRVAMVAPTDSTVLILGETGIERWAIVSGSSDVSIDESWFAGEVTQAAAVDREQAPDGAVFPRIPRNGGTHPDRPRDDGSRRQSIRGRPAPPLEPRIAARTAEEVRVEDCPTTGRPKALSGIDERP